MKIFRALACAAAVLATLASSTLAARACTTGEEQCPAVLKMRPGAVSVRASGTVSGERPNYYFTFEARAGQTLTLRVTGGGLKTGPGIPITFPGGNGDAVNVGQPFKLPETGSYVIVMHANTMSDGPFGRFWLTLKII